MNAEESTKGEIPGERRTILLVTIAAVVLLGAAFWWTAQWMMIRWDQPNSYYSHGWLVLPVSAFLVFLRRRELAACPIRPSWWGLLLLVPAIMVHVPATAWQVGFLSGFSLVAIIAGLVLCLFGTRVFRIVLFPIAFLLFMVPIPEVLIETLSFRLKLLAAKLSAGGLSRLGLAAVREGSYIQIPGGTIVVDDVCSGLKYLIALTAFGALYAYISPVKKWGKLLLFSLAIPISFVANVGRVTLMVLVGYGWGVGATEKLYIHDFFGFFLFVLAFLLLFGTESILLGGRSPNRWGDDEPGDESDDAPSASPRANDGGFFSARTVALALLVPVGLFSTYLAWPRQTGWATGGLEDFPRRVGEWRGEEVEVPDRIYEVLGTRNVLTRLYRRDDDRTPINFQVVLARQMRRRTHPPEQCYTGGGYRLTQSRVRLVQLDDGSELSVREIVLRKGSERRIVWYFYKSGSHYRTSYWFHQAMVALNKLTDPGAADVLVKVDVSVRPANIDSGRRRLQEFIGAAISPVREYVP